MSAVGETGSSSGGTRLSVRELPTDSIALASVVKLSGPYSVSASTGRPDLAGRIDDGRASLAAVSSILPHALEGEVLAEGSVFSVAGLFALIVVEVCAEEQWRVPAVEVGSTGGVVVVRVHGATELRLLPPTRSRRGGVAGPAESVGPLADGAAAASSSADAGSVNAPRSWQKPTDDKGVAVAEAEPSGTPATAGLSAPQPYRSPGAREWIRLVERDFGGLGDDVATAIAAVGTVLRGSEESSVSETAGGDELTAPASGLLCHGPTGVGKTLLARSVAEHSGAPWFFLDCASVFRRDRGEAEQYVQEFLARAWTCSPSVVVLDQVECICRRRPEAAGITELQVLSVLLEAMDRFRRPPSAPRVFFLATCPDPAALGPSLLQRGRLEAVLRLGALDSAARASILSIHARDMVLEVLPSSPPLPSRPPPEPPVAAATAGAAMPPHPPYEEKTDVVDDESPFRLEKPNREEEAEAAAATPVSAVVALTPPAVSPPRTRDEFLELVAARCHGYLGSDLERLCREAAMSHFSAATAAGAVDVVKGAGRHEAGGDLAAIGGCGEGGGGDKGGAPGVRLLDFWAALNVVRPASLAGHSAGMWGGDVGKERGEISVSPPLVGCDAAMAELRAFVLTPLANPDLLRDLGLKGATGALLHGPPGCGKTSVARALAAEVEGVANFLEVRCSDLVDKVVGRSERNVSDLFAAARAAAPCVLFLDQVEGVAARRGYHSSTEQTFDRILSTLLVEMDGVMSESGGHVVVLAATNDIDRLDPALLRPGRLDRRVHLGVPDSASRAAIFLQRLRGMPLRMEEEVEGGGDGRDADSGGAALQGEVGHGEGGVVGERGELGASGATDAAAAAEVVNDSGNADGGSGSCGTPILGRQASGQVSSDDWAGTGVPPRQRSPSQPQPPQIPAPLPRARRRRGLLDSAEAYAEWLAGETEGSSGAHVTGVCREAALAALREGIGSTEVAQSHFEAALGDRRRGRDAAAGGGGQPRPLR
ncbi:cell division control protein [Ectocarpus siliculosus]|uniref:Cell division control protein n=1 Tax=Ectocarpus siliculosus TaxID=2880 RepID=D8LB69_ECTSI|nr:cell division control protein [Ectocarpus siliculosus]|eukprot:CBN76578.1 cell division control protein [Ectocarpus siliculosus]